MGLNKNKDFKFFCSDLVTMWIPGTWKLRSCLGHDNLDVDGTGDMVKYCKVVTAVSEEGEMEILICPQGEPDLNIVFRLENTEDNMRSGLDNTNQMRIGKPTDNGMVIEELNVSCEFDELQLTITRNVGGGFPGFTITKVFDMEE